MAVTLTLPFARPEDHYWTDVDNNFWSSFGPPNRIIKKAELDRMLGDGADAHLFKQSRKCIYHHYNGSNYTDYDVELTLYIMTAASLTLFSGAATQVRGLLLGEDGAVTDATDTQYTIAGMMFPYYYTSPRANDSCVEDALEVGDAIWVIRNGVCEHKNSGGSLDEALLTTAASGAMATSAAYVEAGPQTQEICEEHNWLERAIGRAKAAVLTGAYGMCRLCMPPRHFDP
jgi:hypothetical protein